MATAVNTYTEVVPTDIIHDKNLRSSFLQGLLSCKSPDDKVAIDTVKDTREICKQAPGEFADPL